MVLIYARESARLVRDLRDDKCDEFDDSINMNVEDLDADVNVQMRK